MIKGVFGNNVNIWILSPYAQNGYLQTDDGVDDYFFAKKSSGSGTGGVPNSGIMFQK